MAETSNATCHTWLTNELPKDVATVVKRIRRTEDVQHVAIMPDVHLAGNVCNGTVMATSNLIYPEAIGGDIGCGMAAVAFDCNADVMQTQSMAMSILEKLKAAVPIIRRAIPVADPWLDRTSLRAGPLNRIKQRDGRAQLGTLGRGNHFLEFQCDQEGRLWLMVHSGSRAMGQAVRDWYMKQSHGESHGLSYLKANTLVGQAFLRDQGWARAYAERNRQCMVLAAAQMLRRELGIHPDFRTWIRTDHNHVQLERHFGSLMWVHRKGAARARHGLAGVIPGSMGTSSFHVIGRGEANSLASSSHGAGRALPRETAKRQISVDALVQQMNDVAFDRKIASRLLDEAPQAYRDIRTVMRAQRNLIKIARTLYPVMVYKGG